VGTYREILQVPVGRGAPPGPAEVGVGSAATSITPPGPGALAITAIGLSTSLGAEPAAFAAAVRAGITRPAPLPDVEVVDLDEHVTEAATGYPVDVAEGYTGVGRLALLATSAIARVAPALRKGARTGLYLCLPRFEILDSAERAAIPPEELPEGSLAADARARAEARVVEAILEDGSLPFGPEHVQVFFEDAPGFVSALREARARLQAGEQQAIICGVDSLVDGPIVEALLHLGLLKTPENATGTSPGEAAAWLVLERVETARRAGVSPLAYVESSEMGGAPPPEGRPPDGALLARVVAASLDHATGGRDVGPLLVVADLDGTSDRARDWGGALVRTTAGVRNARVWSPAESLGSIGAAFGPVAACLIAAAGARKALPASRVLLWLSALNGARGAVVLLAADAGVRR
jgi:3-oxoacyl-[acyl-carrier-protein] synthase-1